MSEVHIYQTLTALPEPNAYNCQTMKKKDVQAFFDWFLAQIPQRTEYLWQRSCAALNLPLTPPPFTVDSLEIIWRFYLMIYTVEETRIKSLDDINMSNRLRKQFLENPEQGEEFLSSVRRHTPLHLTPSTEMLLLDLGMYFGEVFIHNHPSLRWDYFMKPKYNLTYHPVLMGGSFGPLDPVNVCQLEAYHILRYRAEPDQLVERYRYHEHDISE